MCVKSACKEGLDDVQMTVSSHKLIHYLNVFTLSEPLKKLCPDCGYP